MSVLSSCGVCGSELRGSLVRCDRCETPHHQDCWQYNAGCAVFACNPATRATPVKGKAIVRAWLAPAMAMMAVAFGATWFYIGAHTPERRLEPAPVVPVTVPLAASAPAPAGVAVGTDVGMLAPDFRILDIDHNETQFRAISRGKVTVLTFWLAYCADCMPHVPPWAQLYQRYQESDDLALVNVAAFTHDSPYIRDFVEKFSIGGRVLLDGTGEAVRTYGVSSITVFVLDEEGRIRYAGSQARAAADVVEKTLASLGRRPNVR